MNEDPPRLMERAFALAQSGQCANMDALRKALRQEGFGAGVIDAHLTGKSLREQLTSLIMAHRPPPQA
jgi:hypothetical protein